MKEDLKSIEIPLFILIKCLKK